jgi:hypothetical protein
VLAEEPDHGEAAIGLLALSAAAEDGDRRSARQAARRAVTTLLDPDRVWEGRPLPTRPDKAVEIAGHLAALDPPGEGPFLRETVKRALADLERRAETSEGATDVDLLFALAQLEVRAAEVFGEPARLGRAAGHLREAHRFAPRAAPVLISLVSVLGRMGRHGEAREMQRRLEALGRRRR